MVAAVRCAPPANKPTPDERDTCAPWLVAEELRQMAASVRVMVCLGGFAWQALWPVLRATGFALPPRRPPFGHGAEAEVQPPARQRPAGPAPRLLPPQPAKHLHRPRHPAMLDASSAAPASTLPERRPESAACLASRAREFAGT